MKNEWFIEPKHKLNNENSEACSKLLDFMNQIDEGRGWRYTDAQAETLAKLVDSLFEQIRAYNKERNKDRKRRGMPFFK